MKQNIIKPMAVLMLLIGMAGIAVADPCPNPGDDWQNKDESDLVTVVESVVGNTATYYVGGAPSSDGAMEVCIESDSANALSGSNDLSNSLTFHLKSTGGPSQNDWAQFGPSSSTIPLNGAFHTVGTVTWDDDPGTVNYLVHVKSTTAIHRYCPQATGDTCFVRPIGPSPPVSELSPLLLTSAGLLGIVLVSRKFRGK